MESEGVSLPLIHKHLMVPWNDKKKGDCCGRFEDIIHGYYCKICDFFVHKKCSQSAKYIKHPLHSGHKLQLRINLTLANSCDACGKSIKNLFYRCQICDFDVDLCCAKYPPPEVTEVPKTHGHKLTLFKERIKFDCGAKCGKIGEYEFPYICGECDLAFHVDCVWQPVEVKRPLKVKRPLEYTTMEPEGVSIPLIHEHLMVRWNYPGKGDCCGRFESITDGFYCKGCDFFVHKSCSESSEYINHPLHSDHTLKLRRYTTSPRRVCDLCGLLVGHKSVYSCDICDFDVDLYCVKYPPPEVIEVSETHGHKLTLSKNRSRFSCGAKCGKTQNGTPYKCDECDLSFHIDCIWHPVEANHPLEANNDRRNDEQIINGAGLQQTLVAVQENTQATIHNLIQELTNAVLQQRKQYHVSDELNPLAEGGVCCNSGRDHEDRRWESGFRLDIPEFHGYVKGEEILDWFVLVEQIFEFKEVPEDKKVALVATKFRGKAAIWWFQLKATRSRAGKEKVKSWEKLQKLLKKGFLPYNFDQTMSNRLKNLRQGARSVDDYADEFSLLLTRNEIFDSELKLVSRFIGGLRPVIRSRMTQFDPTTVAKAHARAIELEQELESSSAWSVDTNHGGGMASFSAPVTWEEEHSEKNLEEYPSVVYSLTATVINDPSELCCFSCGDMGHLETTCPKQESRGLLLEEPKWDMDEHAHTEEELPEDLP